MMLLTAARQTQRAVHSAIAGILPVSAQLVSQGGPTAVSPRLVNLPFILDGERLGSVRKLSAARMASDQVPALDLTVDLESSDDGRLVHCDLVPRKRGEFDFDSGFRCARPGEGPWIPLGSVRFEPDGLRRPLEASKAAAEELARGDPFEVRADLGSSVRVKARGDSGGLVQVLANDNGAAIKVNDAVGRVLLRLLADSNGASLRVRGRDGRDLVRMEAGEGGFSLVVDTSGAAH
jgi:hypothetical protein